MLFFVNSSRQNLRIMHIICSSGQFCPMLTPEHFQNPQENSSGHALICSSRMLVFDEKQKKKGETIVLCRRNGNGKKKWSLEDAKNKSNEMRSWKGKKVVEGQYKTLGKSRATPRPSNPMADNGHKKGCTLARTMRVAHGSRSTHTNLLQVGKQRIKRLKPIEGRNAYRVQSSDGVDGEDGTRTPPR